MEGSTAAWEGRKAAPAITQAGGGGAGAWSVHGGQQSSMGGKNAGHGGEGVAWLLECSRAGGWG
eukprot:35790-Chlamydomonas_euryale.AAC.1